MAVSRKRKALGRATCKHNENLYRYVDGLKVHGALRAATGLRLQRSSKTFDTLQVAARRQKVRGKGKRQRVAPCVRIGAALMCGASEHVPGRVVGNSHLPDVSLTL